MSVPVHIELPAGGDRIEARAKWYPGAPQEAKSIPGARWNKDLKVWHYPLTIDICKKLRDVYGDRLVVGSNLASWYRNASKLQKEMRELGTAIDAELSKVPQMMPFMAGAMEARTYQKSGAKFVAKGRSVGMFDEVGLGKTITTIAGIVEGGNWEGNHLVVSNKTSLESVWLDQLLKWTEGRAEVFVPNQTTTPQRKKVIQAFMDSTAESKWLVINPKMLEIKKAEYCKKCKKFESDISTTIQEGPDMDHWTMAHKTVKETLVHKFPELQTIEFNAIVVDEAHKVLSTGIKSTQKRTQTAEGLLALKQTRDCMRIALTGTPSRGNEMKLFGIMHWLWPSQYSSKWTWVDLYFNKTETFFGTEIGGLREDAQERFWALLDQHVLRRTRREVRGDLPEGVSAIEWVTMNPAHRKQYKDFEDMAEVALDNGDDLIADGILAEMTRLKQMAFGVWSTNSKGKLVPTEKSSKLDRLTDMLEERGLAGTKDDFKSSEDHYKYIVASQFTEIVDFIQEHFESRGIATLKITGAVTGAKRAEAVRSFHEDPDGPRLLVMNTYAGGESITLDKYCDTMFILDETFIADDNLQLYGRIDNRSVTAEEAVPRYFIHLCTKDTIDEQIAEGNLDQLAMEHNLLDSRRGVEFAKTLIRR